MSKEGKSKHQLWQELCVLISRNPDKITSLKVEPIIRGGLKRFTDVIGQLWCSLADYFIRAGHFEKVSEPVPAEQLTCGPPNCMALGYLTELIKSLPFSRCLPYPGKRHL